MTARVIEFFVALVTGVEVRSAYQPHLVGVEPQLLLEDETVAQPEAIEAVLGLTGQRDIHHAVENLEIGELVIRRQHGVRIG